jgi:hypothetical protein
MTTETVSRIGTPTAGSSASTSGAARRLVQTVGDRLRPGLDELVDHRGDRLLAHQRERGIAGIAKVPLGHAVEPEAAVVEDDPLLDLAEIGRDQGQERKAP